MSAAVTYVKINIIIPVENADKEGENVEKKEEENIEGNVENYDWENGGEKWDDAPKED